MKFDAFSFTGRIHRAKFWRIRIGVLLANAFFHIWVALKHGHDSLYQHPMTTGGWILIGGIILVAVVGLWVSLAADVKRYHDRDKSGWWVLIILIPVVGYAWFFVECGFLPGTSGPNRFGPDPLSAR
jgi:uncharacterized membrane protein YhaH (DUF805 family)